MAGAGCQVAFEVFEGPLDLLLHLVKKHELDVMDIPIAFISEKYLEYLDLMTALNLDIAGEYLLMAATLAHLKSRELVPTPDPVDDGAETDEEIDSRQELVRRLLQYQKYKEAAQRLAERPVVGRNVWTRGMTGDEPWVFAEKGEHAPLAEVPVVALLEALERILERARVIATHTIDVDRVSVNERIGQIAHRLDREASFPFASCFVWTAGTGPAALRHEIVVTFLALLEMARLGLIRLLQHAAGDGGDILVVRSAANVSDLLAQRAAVADQYQ